jgi:hypothetical protein
VGGDSRAERARARIEILLSCVIEAAVEITVKLRIAGWRRAIACFKFALS